MRRAIAMIELIFAIVVIGFVLSSVPNLISVAGKSIYTSLQQEAINAALSQMSMVMEAQWDNADTNYTNGSPVLEVDSTILPLPPIGSVGDTLPFGVTTQTGRRCVYNDSNSTRGHATPPSALGKDNTDMEGFGYFDDVDDYDGKTTTIVGGTSQTGDYIDNNISMLTKVYYGDDQPKVISGSNTNFNQNMEFSNPFRKANISTNIKIITIDLTSTNPITEIGSKQIRFSTFMCNIGSPNKILTNEP